MTEDTDCERGNDLLLFPDGDPNLSRGHAAPRLRRDGIAQASRGTLDHYQHIGFGLRESHLQIKRTKPQGFGSSIEMQRAIKFIICLQMRCTPLECVGVCSGMQVQGPFFVDGT